MDRRQGKYRQSVKDQGEEVHDAHLRSDHLGTNTFENRYPTALLHLPVILTNFALAGGWARTTPIDQRMWMRPSIQRKSPGSGTAPLIEVDLGSCYLLQPPSSQLLCPTSGAQRLWCHRRTRKRSPCYGRHMGHYTRPDSPPISRPTEQGFQSDNTEKGRQRATQPDRLFDRKRFRVFSVHLHNCPGCYSTEYLSICGTPVWIRWSLKSLPKTNSSSCRRPWTDLNLSV